MRSMRNSTLASGGVVVLGRDISSELNGVAILCVYRP